MVVRDVCVYVWGWRGGVRKYSTSRELPCGIIDHFVSHICHIKVVNWLFKALHNPFHTYMFGPHACICGPLRHSLVRLAATCPFVSLQRFLVSTDNERHQTEGGFIFGMCVMWWDSISKFGHVRTHESLPPIRSK